MRTVAPTAHRRMQGTRYKTEAETETGAWEASAAALRYGAVPLCAVSALTDAPLCAVQGTGYRVQGTQD